MPDNRILTEEERIRQRIWDYLLGTERRRKLTIIDIQLGNEMFNHDPSTCAVAVCGVCLGR